MATVSGKREKGGFDCEFVQKPPEAVQSECPVCLQILCEPYQAPCCGNSFCRVCIERIKTDNKPCPTCNEENFVTFHNKGLQRSLNGFQVYCSQKQKGCEWKGELGQLDNHLTVKCKYGKVIDCDFHHVGCDVKLPRIKMQAHLKENLVTHMSLQAASYKQLQEKVNKLENENQTLKHQLEATRAENQQHSVKIQRIEMQLLRLAMPPPPPPPVAMSARATSPPRVQPQIKQLAGTIVSCSIEMIMENFSDYKSDSDIWYSPPFYSHPQGYKFRLRVDANGDGIAKGTHLSVFTCVIKGEFDAQLKWPFCGRIVVQLVDQSGRNDHYTGTIPYTDTTPREYSARVTQGDRSESWGLHKYIVQNQLEPNYLRNNRLHFRITKFKFD